MPAKPLPTHGSVDAAACARPRVRQPGLDLLWALAIVLVVLYHGGIFGFTLPGEVQRFGWVGVDLFFVLSGYLIGGQLLAPLATLLVVAVSPRLPWHRVAVPGAAAVARIAYSVYLSHKLSMHGAAACCGAWGLPLTTALAHALNLAAIALVGAGLSWAVARPFLRLRGRVLVQGRAKALTTGGSDPGTITT